MNDELPPTSPPPFEGHDWVRPGATFVEAGEAKRIIRIKHDAVEGVSSSGSFWKWWRPGFLAALQRGDIQQASHATRERAPAPKRNRPVSDARSRKALAAIRDHPLLRSFEGDLHRVAARALRALQDGEPAETPHLLILTLLAQAGATARGLGSHAAQPPRKSGRAPRYARAARETQDMLQRFGAFIEGCGDFNQADFQAVQALILQGLSIVSGAGSEPLPPAGRPPTRQSSVRAVKARLAVQRRTADGSYRLSNAIRSVAEVEVLHAKRGRLAWSGEDVDMVRLDASDADALRLSIDQIERAVHRSNGANMSADEIRDYRRLAAIALCFKRRLLRRQLPPSSLT